MSVTSIILIIVVLLAFFGLCFFVLRLLRRG